MFRKILPFLLIFIIVTLFFKDFLFRGLIPLPADTIVGMYHPWRDFYAKDYPRGIPFKNSLITDPVRQQYPWKYLVIEELKRGKLPTWNPYSFSGTPLLANFQSGTFYIFNIIFFIFNFNTAWGIYIYLQFILGGIFMYLYLNNLNLRKEASLLGSLAFIFSGVFIAWGWWGNIIHTLIWLPLILLCIDKINISFKDPCLAGRQERPKTKDQILWSLFFIISICSSLFAGHLQAFFYVFLTTLLYIIIKIVLLACPAQAPFTSARLEASGVKKALCGVTCALLLVTVITSIQWLPTLNFINQSARSLDQANWQREGWFLPWQNLVQLTAPDFFGNPATGNYWGVWNYGEFVGYIGILPLIMALYALVFRKDKKTLFFGSLFFTSLIFALPTPLAKLPYILKLPLIATSQPTRLLLLTDFSLVILSALGLDYLLREGKLKNLLKIIFPLFLLFLLLWLFVVFSANWLTSNTWQTNLAIAKRNLILPTVLFFISALILGLLKSNQFNNETMKQCNNHTLFNKLIGYSVNRLIGLLLIACCLLLVAIDLFRFGWKFLPFTKEEYIYPKTKTIEFLKSKQKEGNFRIMSTDERIFPPNFSIMYQIESVDGYDPLFLKSYADLINKMENRLSGSGFNRIITPKNFNSPVIKEFNVRFVLSLTDLKSPKLKKVFSEGQTQVYEIIN